MFLHTYKPLLIFLFLLPSCTPDPVPITDECNISFFDISMQQSYSFDGRLTACYNPNPNDLVNHEQDAQVNFISYENDSLKFELITESDLLTNDTILTYRSFCFEGSDGPPGSESDDLSIWIYNDVDTIGSFRRSESKFAFYFDYELFKDDCFPQGTDVYFSGKLK